MLLEPARTLLSCRMICYFSLFELFQSYEEYNLNELKKKFEVS